MFNDLHYVPILKAKEGEFQALCNLKSEPRLVVTPMIDVPQVGWDWRRNQPKKSLQSHLRDVADRLAESWASHAALFIDPFFIDFPQETSIEEHPLPLFMGRIQNKGLIGIPTTGLDRDSTYNMSVARVIQTGKNGVCIRLQDEDLQDPDALDRELGSLLEALQVKPADVHLLIDLRALEARDLDKATELVIRALIGLSNASTWKTLTLSASGFPGSLKGVEANSIAILPRTELALWKRIRARKSDLPRLPSYSDHAIAHPDFLDIDPRKLKLSAAIRYTLEQDFMIIKGASFQKQKYSQFHDLSAQLIDQREYCGRDYSWGDRYIQDCADKEAGCGNLTTWRAVGTSHHIAVVVRLLSRLRSTT